MAHLSAHGPAPTQLLPVTPPLGSAVGRAPPVLGTAPPPGRGWGANGADRPLQHHKALNARALEGSGVVDRYAAACDCRRRMDHDVLWVPQHHIRLHVAVKSAMVPLRHRPLKSRIVLMHWQCRSHYDCPIP